MDEDIPVDLVVGTDEHPKIAEIASLQFVEREGQRYASIRAVIERPVQGTLSFQLGLRGAEGKHWLGWSAQLPLNPTTSTPTYPRTHVFKLALGRSRPRIRDENTQRDERPPTYRLQAWLSPLESWRHGRSADAVKVSTDVTSLEILGVGGWTGEGVSWWRPDGRPLASPTKLKPREGPQWDPDYVRKYWLLVRSDGAPEDVWFGPWPDMNAVPSAEQAIGPDGEPIPRHWVLPLRLPADQKEVLQAYGLALGPWKTLTSHRASRGPIDINAQGARCRISEIMPDSKHPDRTLVRAVCKGKWDVRAVVVDHDGKEHAPINAPDSKRQLGRIWTSHWSQRLVFDVPLDDINLIRFQQRTRKHFVITGISLEPGRITQPRIALYLSPGEETGSTQTSP